MWRGLLCFVFVVGTIALIAPPRPHVDYPGPDQSRATEKSKAAPITPPLQQGADPALYKEPCRNTPQDRESDLCAQWKSADWTKWGVLVGIIGTIALVYQIILTRMAVQDTGEATGEMRKANTISREVAAAELRAWVVIEPRITKFKADDWGIEARYEIVFKNVGHTAARDIWLKFTATFLLDAATERIDAVFAEWRDLEPDYVRTLMPGEEHRGQGSCMSAWKPQRFGDGTERAMWVIIAAVRYWSAMDNEWHTTERSFMFGIRGSDSLVGDRYIPVALRGEWKGDAVAEKFIVQQFYAGETT